MTDGRRAVCAIVVNWNGWQDTQTCLDSLLAVEGYPLSIIVCDNASTDGSTDRLSEWMRFRLNAEPRAEENVLLVENLKMWGDVNAIYILRMPSNLGYAGALNAGIRWAQSRWGAASFWLLNNDVKAQRDSLAALVAAKDETPRVGLCGSVLLEWESADEVQAVAGMFRRTLGVGRHVKVPPPDAGAVFIDVDYPVGASLFVEQEYLDRVGLMDEGYFLYCEEMDWAERGRRLGLRPAVALGSRLQHKEGASTGSRRGVRNKSLTSERHGVISRLRITRKLWPAYLPLVWMSLWLVVADRLAHGEVRRAALVLRLMFSPWRWLGPSAS